jgi:hypothetical protein
MKRTQISQDFEAYELDGLLFWFHVDAEIHSEKDENNQTDSLLYYADVSNGCYAESQEAADNGQYFDMTSKQIKAVERSLTVESFEF